MKRRKNWRSERKTKKYRKTLVKEGQTRKGCKERKD